MSELSDRIDNILFAYRLLQCDADEIRKVVARVEELEALINTPEILDFVKAVQLEAAHQCQRWGTEHDRCKTDADWYWLIGYLAAKAMWNPGEPGPTYNHTREDSALTPCPECMQAHDAAIRKQLHRIITVAAAACNWHAQRLPSKEVKHAL